MAKGLGFNTVRSVLPNADERLEIFLTEGRATPNWFWYIKDRSGKIIKRCRPGGCESYMMATQEAIDEYSSLQKGNA